MTSCPYNARYYNRETQSVDKCDFCSRKRLQNGSSTPACVEACSAENHNPMIFGDLNDPNSPISVELKKHGGKQLRPDLALNTGVRYQGL